MITPGKQFGAYELFSSFADIGHSRANRFYFSGHGATKSDAAGSINIGGNMYASSPAGTINLQVAGTVGISISSPAFDLSAAKSVSETANHGPITFSGIGQCQTGVAGLDSECWLVRTI